MGIDIEGVRDANDEGANITWPGWSNTGHYPKNELTRKAESLSISGDVKHETKRGGSAGHERLIGYVSLINDDS
jgi:hypothetical protein